LGRRTKFWPTFPSSPGKPISPPRCTSRLNRWRLGPGHQRPYRAPAPNGESLWRGTHTSSSHPHCSASHVVRALGHRPRGPTRPATAWLALTTSVRAPHRQDRPPRQSTPAAILATDTRVPRAPPIESPPNRHYTWNQTNHRAIKLGPPLANSFTVCHGWSTYTVSHGGKQRGRGERSESLPPL
jgi:hypothetical protein